MGSNASEKKTVVVTGFGPFGVHSINASWEAVKELEKTGISPDIRLITLQIPVEYKCVKRILYELWEVYSPRLMVHVGVSGAASELVIEKLAHNKGYCAKDNCDSIPSTQCCVTDGPDVIMAEINMDVVCQTVNESDCGVLAVTSRDPGRYLCEYSYYLSLSINSKACAFIHVPPLNKPYSASQLASGLRIAITSMLQQVELV